MPATQSNVFTPRVNMMTFADIVIRAAIERTPDYPGGYICIAGENGIPDITFSLGKNNGTFGVSFSHAQQEAARLAQHATHRTSRTIPNGPHDRKVCAIRGKQYIYAFASLPQEICEAALLLMAIMMDDITLEECRAIASASGNAQFEDFLMAADPEGVWWKEKTAA